MVVSTTPGALSEEARRKAEQLSSTLFDNQFLMVLDQAQHSGYVSPNCARLLGYAVPTVTVALLQQAIHPDDAPLVLRAAELAEEFADYLRSVPPEGGGSEPLASGASIDYRLRCHSGAYVRVLRQNFVLLPPREGQPAVLGSVFTDITGHKTSCDVRFHIDHPEFAGWIRTRKVARTQDMLSLREQEILARMLAGGTTASLCSELFISEMTLKTHRRNIHRKMKFHALAMHRRETLG